MVNLRTKFEVSNFIHYEDMNGDANVEYGVVWGVMGCSSSSAMSPFDRAHATSYSSIIDWNLLWSNNVANLKCLKSSRHRRCYTGDRWRSISGRSSRKRNARAARNGRHARRPGPRRADERWRWALSAGRPETAASSSLNSTRTHVYEPRHAPLLLQRKRHASGSESASGSVPSRVWDPNSNPDWDLDPNFDPDRTPSRTSIRIRTQTQNPYPD